MIKIALKHWIYEICIDRIFSNIQKNFIPPNPKTCIIDNNIKNGDMFRKIIVSYDWRSCVYYHAVVTYKAKGTVGLLVGECKDMWDNGRIDYCKNQHRWISNDVVMEILR